MDRIRDRNAHTYEAQRKRLLARVRYRSIRKRCAILLTLLLPPLCIALSTYQSGLGGFGSVIGRAFTELLVATGRSLNGAYDVMNGPRIERSKRLVRNLSAAVFVDTIPSDHHRNGIVHARQSRTERPLSRLPVESRAPGSAPPRESEHMPFMYPEDTRGAVVVDDSIPPERGKSTVTTAQPQERSGQYPEEPRHVFRVLLIGVDSRLGRSDARADALQLLAVDLDKGRVEITAIPRGTPVSLGYSDPSANIISHVLPARGRAALLRAVRRVTGGDPVSHYMEIGFSQAMGMLELLGYTDPAAELRFLRRRKGLQYGDRERSYTQALFLKKTLLKTFDLFTGVGGEIIVRAGLAMVETNMTPDICRGLIYALKETGFPRRPEDVAVRVHSPLEARVVNKQEEISRREMRSGIVEISGVHPAERVIRRLLRKCGSGGDLSPPVRRKLERIIAQRGWLQVQEPLRRTMLRDSLVNRLLDYYLLRNDGTNATLLRERIAREDTLFNNASYLRTGTVERRIP